MPKKKRKMKPRRRTRIVEEVYAPRIWVWVLTLCIGLQLLGFATCRSSSRGCYYRQRLFACLSDFIESLIAKCREHATYSAPFTSCLWYHLRIILATAFQMLFKCWRQRRDIGHRLLSWISSTWNLLRDDFTTFTKYFLFAVSWTSHQWNLFRDGFSKFSKQYVVFLLHYPRLATLVLALLLGTLAFWKRPELRVQFTRPSLNPKNPITKARARSIRLWPIAIIIYSGTVMLCLLLLYWSIFADKEAFWKWSDGAP